MDSGAVEYHEGPCPGNEPGQGPCRLAEFNCSGDDGSRLKCGSCCRCLGCLWAPKSLHDIQVEDLEETYELIEAVGSYGHSVIGKQQSEPLEIAVAPGQLELCHDCLQMVAKNHECPEYGYGSWTPWDDHTWD